MQMNVLRAKQVSHVGSGDDHGQPITVATTRNAGDLRRVGSSRQVFRSHLLNTCIHTFMFNMSIAM